MHPFRVSHEGPCSASSAGDLCGLPVDHPIHGNDRCTERAPYRCVLVDNGHTVHRDSRGVMWRYDADGRPITVHEEPLTPHNPDAQAALWLPASRLKMLWEMLAQWSTQPGVYKARQDLIKHLHREIEKHRPLGSDGKHGDLHTATCGCEDVEKECFVKVDESGRLVPLNDNATEAEWRYARRISRQIADRHAALLHEAKARR